MKIYKIYTLGCKVNQYDSGKLANELARAGLVMAAENADVAIINSCAVTKTAMIKSGRIIKLAKKQNPKAKIILAGCWPKAGGDKVGLAGADLIVKAGEVKDVINQIFNFPRLRQDKQFSIFNECHNPNGQNNKIIINNERARYFIKIQDGCEQYCSYCIIPYARGGLKSRPEAEVAAEIKQAVKAGYGEIVLSGIHLGLYGKESAAARDGNLVSLLKKLIKIKNLGRIRLSSIEITEVTDELISLMMKSGKICKHLHIPLQAGCDSVLKKMNRPYNVEYFKNKIKQIRRAMPDISITTDVITGFPGETEKDFRETEEFIKQIKFSRLHVFPFSAHAKLPAAKMPGQIDEKNKARRAGLLRKLGVKLAADYKKQFRGRELEIAVEQIKQNKIMGKTEFYFDLEIDKAKINRNLKIGQIVKVKN